MEFEFRRDIEDFFRVISRFEKRRNKALRRKIAFLRKYLGVWNDEYSHSYILPNNPNPFFLNKEKLDA